MRPNSRDADHAEEHRGAERLTQSPPGADRDRQRQHAKDEGEAGHQDRPQPGPGASAPQHLGGSCPRPRPAWRIRRSGSRSSLPGRSARRGRSASRTLLSKPCKFDADHRREHTHRHDQDDRQRQHPAFVQRRQQEEDEDHRQRRRRSAPQCCRRLLLQGDLCPFEAEPAAAPSGRSARSPRALAGRVAARHRHLHSTAGRGCSACTR
jgi:hypothetical protein